MADGLVDVVADSFVYTHDRYRYVDFAYPEEIAETNIIFHSSSEISGRFLSTAFPSIFYVLLLFSTLFMFLITFYWVKNLESDNKRIQVKDFVVFAGKFFTQPFPQKWNMSRLSTCILFATFDIFTLFFTLMYSGRVMSIMMTTSQKVHIDNLDDLVNVSNSQIYVFNNSFVHDLLDDVESLNKLKMQG